MTTPHSAVLPFGLLLLVPLASADSEQGAW